VVGVKVFVNGRLRVHRRGRNLRSVTIARLPVGPFRVRIVNRQSNGSRVISTRTYQGCTQTNPRNRYRHRHRHHA
jgi:hypothetical protein